MDYLITFAHCIVVKGARRSIICDIQRSGYEFVPNTMSDFLQQARKEPIKSILDNFDADEKSIAETYIDFLIRRQYAFLTSNPEYFPPLNMSYRARSVVDNAIIDWDKNSKFNYQKAVNELMQLNCQSVELRFFDHLKVTDLQKILSFFDHGPVRSIDIVLKFEQTDTLFDDLAKLTKSYNRISTICIHSIPKDHPLEHIHAPRLLLTTESIRDESHCGIVNSSHFSVNQNMFLESVSHNNCLNNKIAIDKSGKIKNCPSMNKDYGHIDTVNLKEALHDNNFRSLWDVNKDRIEVCRDCEFRYICPDCRVYTNDGRTFSKPKKCSYNPYEARWEDIAV